MSEWKPVTHINEIPINKLKSFRVDNQDVFVYRTEDSYHVYPNRCTHQAVPLSDGYLVNGTVICRLHGAKYDLRTGASLRAPAYTNLQAYPTMVREGVLYIDCSDRQPMTIRRCRFKERQRARPRSRKRQESFVS